jgi:hypothetical protein
VVIERFAALRRRGLPGGGRPISTRHGKKSKRDALALAIFLPALPPLGMGMATSDCSPIASATAVPPSSET